MARCVNAILRALDAIMAAREAPPLPSDVEDIVGPEEAAAATL